jgi:uncharacterized C2H2 Zn-finger protein
MVKRKCPKCEAEFYKKSHYDRHMNRIYDCNKKNKKSNNDNDLQKLIEINKNSQNLTEDSQNLTEINKNSQNLIDLTHVLMCSSSPESLIPLTEIDEYVNIDEISLCCSFCSKKLVNKYSLIRHIK